MLASAGFPELTGRVGIVESYHVDGIAFWVALPGRIRRLLCDPVCVDVLVDPQPARLIGSAT